MSKRGVYVWKSMFDVSILHVYNSGVSTHHLQSLISLNLLIWDQKTNKQTNKKQLKYKLPNEMTKYPPKILLVYRIPSKETYSSPLALYSAAVMLF